MAQVYKSGAFIQQCFASHPLCVTFKKFTVPDVLILHCSACRFRHEVRLSTLTTQPSDAVGAEQLLVRCGTEHPAALRMSGMDVVESAMALRCGDCRRSFAVAASAFETHAP